MTFQGLILKLSEFWASRGCTLQQPLDIEVGAGTMHPETFLRVLGPAHWNVAYVQPSRRPADGRFGENPNRLFKHHQFQVILKPSPDEVQQLYLESLEACGINPRQHDIRFEEDNWESPTLGAWGIGWQMLFDGLEITQFTYFQQAGGIELAPISAELTYGLERIAMVLQRVDSVYDLEWSPGVKYRDVRLARRSRTVEVRVQRRRRSAAGRVRRLPPQAVRRLLPVLGSAPAVRTDLAGARALPQVLASVQRARREQQHRRDRADGVSSCACGSSPSASRRPTSRKAAGRSRSRSRRRRRKALGDGSRTAARARLRGAARVVAAGADEPDRRGGRRAADGASASARSAGRDVQHAAAPDRARGAHSRTADRPRGARERPAGVGRVQARRHADAGGRRVRGEAGRRGLGARARPDAQRGIPRLPEAAAGQGVGRRAAGRARRRRCARSRFRN